VEQALEKNIQAIYESLQRLTGLHRQLLDTVRMEREALVAASLKQIEEATLAKQALVEGIRQAESDRLKKVAELAIAWKRPLRELTLPKLIVAIQASHPKLTEQLRSAFNALTLLIKRITDQNIENKNLVEASLMHIQEMKKNVLSETVPKSNTYTAKGKRSNGPSGSRLFEKEA
jgi:flagellar biosynthesis/type III secretory pathway chaperone